MLAAILLARGHRVACITPDPAALESILRIQGVAGHVDLHLMATPTVIPPPLTLWQRLRGLIRPFYTKERPVLGVADVKPKEWKPTLRDRWRLNAHRYVRNAPEVQVTPDLPLQVRVKRLLLQVFVPPVWHILQLVRPLSAHTGIRHPINLVVAANAALDCLPWKPDFLLSMYVDLWMTSPAAWRQSAVRMPLPWGGIRFVPFDERHAGSEGYFRDPMFRGMCFLDEVRVIQYQKRQREKAFEFLPDVANGELPHHPIPLIEEILRRAAGRPVVLLCGSIEGRKNVRLFCETALRPAASSIFFAIVGQLHPTTISREEKVLLDEFARSENGNTIIRDIFFEDEREMNAVIQAADIVFAVYREFPISSNMPSKAAQFRKPILVSDRYLLGERVARYCIGRGVDEDDASAMLAGLEHILATPVPEAHFARYCSDFSLTKFAVRLEAFLHDCLK